MGHSTWRFVENFQPHEEKTDLNGTVIIWDKQRREERIGYSAGIPLTPFVCDAILSLVCQSEIRKCSIAIIIITENRKRE